MPHTSPDALYGLPRHPVRFAVSPDPLLHAEVFRHRLGRTFGPPVRLLRFGKDLCDGAGKGIRLLRRHQIATVFSQQRRHATDSRRNDGNAGLDRFEHDHRESFRSGTQDERVKEKWPRSFGQHAL